MEAKKEGEWNMRPTESHLFMVMDIVQKLNLDSIRDKFISLPGQAFKWFANREFKTFDGRVLFAIMKYSLASSDRAGFGIDTPRTTDAMD